MSGLKFLDIKNLRQTQDFVHQRYCVKLRRADTYGDLFIPTFWSQHRNSLRELDIVRVVAHDMSFDIDLTVVSVTPGGVVMQPRPLFGGKAGAEAIEAAVAAADTASLSKVPFDDAGNPVSRIEHLPATGWRVVGLNGEVSRDHKDEASAQKALDFYLKANRLVMPTAEEIAEAKAKAEADAKARAEAAKAKGKKAA